MKTDVSTENLKKGAYWTIILVGAVFSLIYFRSFLEPIVLALLVWYLIRTTRKYIAKLTIGGRSLPQWLQRVVAFLLTVSFIYGVYQIISVNISLITANSDSYDKNLRLFLAQMREFTGRYDFIPNIEDAIQSIDYQSILSKIFNSLSVALGNFALVIVYVVFFLIEENYLDQKLKNMFRKEGSRENVAVIFDRISNSINKYFTVKTEVSLLTGTISYLLLLALGVDFPVLWAFIIFVLNFIPYLGSLVATLLPAIFSIFQFASFWPFLYVFLIIEAVQIFVGNYVEPKLMGRTLNLSPLVVLIALSFWGSIWGILGMILSVPVISVIVIVSAQFKSTRGLAVLLSENGNLSNIEQPDDEM
ncbi:AI-2E family transporter [Roseivirga sp. UBA838]|uniref:AI-2E family transporter n=1 Tax=Roseivirga sp. UBA838 TaxID=1947393 RepID=UPI00257A0E65|nr:AI-2E family transporter [Roseivirga sp. UBA838]|tara:strand:+ start:2360 stop:3442 length:1083 start_codon:yes stop_codon:yes gene_type:complete